MAPRRHAPGTFRTRPPLRYRVAGGEMSAAPAIGPVPAAAVPRQAANDNTVPTWIWMCRVVGVAAVLAGTYFAVA